MNNQIKERKLKKRLQEINNQLNEINSKSLREYQVGDIMTIKFEDVYIVTKKLGVDIFQVVNKGDSIKLKKDDIIKIKDPNSRLEVGEKIEFIVYRPALEYESDPIEDLS